MARTNKYTSINFNHIHEKNVATNTTSPTPNSTSSKHHSPASPPNSFITHKANGRMLVLTRPVSKPVPSPATTATTPPISPLPKSPGTRQQEVQAGDLNRSEPEADQISLRPLGRTGTRSAASSPVVGSDLEREVGLAVGSPKPDKFVPPHLRPGFAGREERPGPEVCRGQRQHQHQVQQQRHGSLVGQFGENGRPKSGGGYERTTRGCEEAEPGLLDRPRSSGNRPSSSG